MCQDIEGVSSAKKAFSSNDRRPEKILQSTTTKVEGRYQIGLLWKDNVDLPNYRWVGERQLSGLEHCLEKDSNLKPLYQKTINDYLAKSYIVQVLPNYTTVKKWYLPLHPVTNIHKLAKVRRVTNASLCHQRQSTYWTRLPLQSHRTNIALPTTQSRDIYGYQGYVQQSLVDPKDRPFLRFLWRNNKTMFDYENTTHIFGATDSPCVACYAVQRCPNDNADDHPDIPVTVQRNFYVDDLYLSLPTDEEATDTAHILLTVLSTGGFNLTKWSSNSRNFLKGLKSELRAAGADPDNSLTPQRVLGMPWDAEKMSTLYHRTATKTSRTQKHPLNAVS